MSDLHPFHLAVALDGFGWHPAAWRHAEADAADLFTADYWRYLIAEAERGLLDFVTIEDSIGLESSASAAPNGDKGRARGHLDATVLAARIAPLTSRVGIVPTSSTTHLEPFHISTAIATLDYVSEGRAGWRPQISEHSADAALFGRRSIPELDPTRCDAEQAQIALSGLFDEASEVVEVVRKLWDSWEDDATIRDVTTGRFVDREKLHYIDHVGPRLSIKGPSIVPRPPQGQPVVVALAHSAVSYAFAARSADVVLVTPHTTGEAGSIVAEVRAAEQSIGREDSRLKIFGDLVVFLDDDTPAAVKRKRCLDELDGADFAGDALVFTGTPSELSDLLGSWQQAGLDGFRLRPGEMRQDLAAITKVLVPELRRRGLFRTRYEASTLRGLLGLERPVSRYAAIT